MKVAQAWAISVCSTDKLFPIAFLAPYVKSLFVHALGVVKEAFFVFSTLAKRGRYVCSRSRRRGFGAHGLTSQPLFIAQRRLMSKT